MDDELPRMAPVTYIPPPPPETEDEIFQQPNHEGINFNKYENIPVKITGNEPIAPITDFKDAKLHMVCMYFSFFHFFSHTSHTWSTKAQGFLHTVFLYD